VVGNAIASFRVKDEQHPELPAKDRYVLLPGDSVILFTVGGQKVEPVYDRFIICDYFKSEMSDYDGNYVFVSLEDMQQLRTLQGRVTSIQIKLNDYREVKAVVERLRELFPGDSYNIVSWEDKQGSLLAAISIEKGLLNVLLFLIIGVAGFGILAIFAMI